MVGRRSEPRGEAFGVDLAAQSLDGLQLAFAEKLGAGVGDPVHVLIVIYDKAWRLREGSRAEEQHAGNEGIESVHIYVSAMLLSPYSSALSK
jgi:hypothetical protein